MTVEIDRDLLPALTETVADLPQVRVVSGDALALDWPAIPARAVSRRRRRWSRASKSSPTSPTTSRRPLLTTLLAQSPPFAVIVLLVQKEVAQRLPPRPARPTTAR